MPGSAGAVTGRTVQQHPMLVPRDTHPVASLASGDQQLKQPSRQISVESGADGMEKLPSQRALGNVAHSSRGAIPPPPGWVEHEEERRARLAALLADDTVNWAERESPELSAEQLPSARMHAFLEEQERRQQQRRELSMRRRKEEEEKEKEKEEKSRRHRMQDLVLDEDQLSPIATGGAATPSGSGVSRPVEQHHSLPGSPAPPPPPMGMPIVPPSPPVQRSGSWVRLDVPAWRQQHQQQQREQEKQQEMQRLVPHSEVVRNRGISAPLLQEAERLRQMYTHQEHVMARSQYPSGTTSGRSAAELQRARMMHSAPHTPPHHAAVANVGSGAYAQYQAMLRVFPGNSSQEQGEEGAELWTEQAASMLAHTGGGGASTMAVTSPSTSAVHSPSPYGMYNHPQSSPFSRGSPAGAVPGPSTPARRSPVAQLLQQHRQQEQVEAPVPLRQALHLSTHQAQDRLNQLLPPQNVVPQLMQVFQFFFRGSHILRPPVCALSASSMQKAFFVCVCVCRINSQMKEAPLPLHPRLCQLP